MYLNHLKPHTQNVFTIKLFGLVTSNCKIVLLFIIPHCLRINTVAYIKCLMDRVMPCSSGLLLEEPASGNRILHLATQTCVTLCNTKDELKARITTLSNLNKKAVGQACRKFWSHLEVVVEGNGDFFNDEFNLYNLKKFWCHFDKHVIKWDINVIFILAWLSGHFTHHTHSLSIHIYLPLSLSHNLSLSLTISLSISL